MIEALGKRTSLRGGSGNSMGDCARITGVGHTYWSLGNRRMGLLARLCAPDKSHLHLTTGGWGRAVRNERSEPAVTQLGLATRIGMILRVPLARLRATMLVEASFQMDR